MRSARILYFGLESRGYDHARIFIGADFNCANFNCAEFKVNPVWSWYVGLPLGLIGRLHRLLRSAARLIAASPNMLPFLYYMWDALYWLPVPQRISYRVAVVVWRCILGCASAYLHDLCRPLSDRARRRVFPSSAGGLQSLGLAPQLGSAVQCYHSYVFPPRSMFFWPRLCFYVFPQNLWFFSDRRFFTCWKVLFEHFWGKIAPKVVPFEQFLSNCRGIFGEKAKAKKKVIRNFSGYDDRFCFFGKIS